MSSEISSIDLWTAMFLSCMYWKSPKPMPSAHTSRPQVRMLAPLVVPPKNAGSAKLGSFSDASLARAGSAPKSATSAAANVNQTKRGTNLSISGAPSSRLQAAV